MDGYRTQAQPSGIHDDDEYKFLQHTLLWDVKVHREKS